MWREQGVLSTRAQDMVLLGDTEECRAQHHGGSSRPAVAPTSYVIAGSAGDRQELGSWRGCIGPFFLVVPITEGQSKKGIKGGITCGSRHGLSLSPCEMIFGVSWESLGGADCREEKILQEQIRAQANKCALHLGDQIDRTC